MAIGIYCHLIPSTRLRVTEWSGVRDSALARECDPKSDKRKVRLLYINLLAIWGRKNKRKNKDKAGIWLQLEPKSHAGPGGKPLYFLWFGDDPVIITEYLLFPYRVTLQSHGPRVIYLFQMTVCTPNAVCSPRCALCASHRHVLLRFLRLGSL